MPRHYSNESLSPISLQSNLGFSCVAGKQVTTQSYVTDDGKHDS